MTDPSEPSRSPQRPDPAPGTAPVSRVTIRRAGDAAEERAAGAVTAQAYAEFAPHFDPGEWRSYASTLPVTEPRVAQGELLVAVDEAGAVVGTVTLYLSPQPTSGHWRADDAVIRFLAVAPDRRGEGIATALLGACLDRAEAAGCRRLALQTTPPMLTAIKMYERGGFYRDSAGDQVFGSFVIQGYAKDLRPVTS